MAVLFLIGTLNALAQEKKYSVYAIGFYNLENLFDTLHDEGHNDYEYLPDGRNKWTGMKYRNKLKNMARVLAEMGTDVLPTVGAAAIGVSEVENDGCLADLCEQYTFDVRSNDALTDDVLYSERTPQGNATLSLRQPDDEETPLNLELLFNAAHKISLTANFPD